MIFIVKKYNYISLKFSYYHDHIYSTVVKIRRHLLHHHTRSDVTRYTATQDQTSLVTPPHLITVKNCVLQEMAL